VNRVLYLHGFASGPASSKARYFAAQFRALGVELEIPALDQNDFEHLTISSQLDLIERLAQGSAISLIGSSMGGYLAALYAARHPEVRRIALLAPAFGFARRWPLTLGQERFEEWRRTGVLDFYHYAEQRTLPLRYALIEDALRYEDEPDVRRPALIFHGAHDTVVPPEVSLQFRARHQNAHCEILDSDHELHNMLEWMAPRVTSFLLDL
jgi:pimeloyl-ACP methyl ester carboxylesterase